MFMGSRMAETECLDLSCYKKGGQWHHALKNDQKKFFIQKGNDNERKLGTSRIKKYQQNR